MTLVGLHSPIPKMAGNYNPGYTGNTSADSTHIMAFTFNGEAVTSDGAGAQYNWFTAKNYIDVVIPTENTAGSYTLSDGYIGVGVIGLTTFADGGDSHRNIPDSGCSTRDSQTTLHTRSILPEIAITVAGVEQPEPAIYTVTLPAEPVGYTVVAAEGSTSPVTEGGNYSFTVTIADGYDGTNMVVKANDVVLTAVEGVYTISNITANQTVTVEGVVEKPVPAWQQVMEKTQAYLIGQGEYQTPIVGSQRGKWVILGLARNGAEAAFYDAYYNNVVAYVAENIDAETGRLHEVKSTDNARVILALTALGKDVTNVDGHNLLKAFSDTAYVPLQGINGPVWALIALDSHAYDIPANADTTKQVTRDWLIDYILDNQLAGGGWAQDNKTADDMTPMTVQALAPYYNNADYNRNADVKAAVDKALPIMQGMVESGSPETLAQIIVALSALDIDCEQDERFDSVLDKMLAFALENGTFKKGLSETKYNQMSTEQAFYAMVAYDRFLDEKTNLYDMSDVEIGDNTVAAITLDKLAASVEVGKTLTLTATVSDDIEDKTVIWASSNEAVATVNDGVITGVSEGTADITATVGEHSATCTVTVTKEEEDDTTPGGTTSGGLDFGLEEDEIDGYVYVSFEDKGKRRTGEAMDPEFQIPLGTIIGRTKVPFVDGDTIAAVTLRLLEAKGFDAYYQGTETSSFYLEAIGGFTAKGIEYDSFGEFDAGRDSGWMITWDGWFIGQGASEFEVEKNDVIKWQYTCQLGADIGDDYYEGIGGGGGAAVTSEDRAAAKEVKELIEAIGTVDEDSKAAIEAAREAYDKLTEEQKELISIYDELVAAEKAYAELTGEDIAPAADMPYTDTEGHWAANAIEYAYNNGLMTGTTETNFAPNSATSRAMIATILYRLAGSPDVEGEASFADVADGAWYTDAILWAEANGVVSGYVDGSFGPNDNITREQLASILHRYAAYMGQNMNASADLSSFADAAGISEWSRSALAWANAEGLINGKTGNIIDAKGNATRAEVATILMSYIEGAK